MNDEDPIVRIALLEREVSDLRVAVQAQTKATRDLIEAWNSAKWLVGLIRLLGSIAVAIGACYALWRGIHAWDKGGG